MLTAIILLLLLLNGAVFLANIFKRKYEETLIVWIFSIVFILYIFGLINLLKYGVYFILLISIIMLLNNITIFIKSKDKIKETKNFLSPAMIIFFASYIVLCFMHNGRLLIGWDEFSHWGDSVKVMFNINDFITSPLSDSTFKRYPPSMALFQYFVQILNGSFCEGLLFLCYQIIGVALFLPIFKNLEWKNFSSIITAVFFIIIIPLIFFEDYYTTIYIDAMLGITFGILLIYILDIKKFDSFETLKICLGVSFLVNLKEIGVYLAFIIVVCLLVQLLIKNKNNRSLKKYIPLFLTILSVIFTKLSWNMELHINNIYNESLSGFSLKNLFDIIIGKDISYKQIVTTNFFNAIFNNTLVYNFIDLSMMKIIIILLFLTVYYVKKDKKYGLNFLIVFIGLIIYLFGLLILYYFHFSEYEATNIASYARYASIYLAGYLVFLALYYYLINNKKNILFLSIILLFYAPFNNLTYNQKKVSYEEREKYMIDVSYINRHLNKNDKLYIISQKDTGYDYLILRYDLRPIVTAQFSSWSLGKPYYDGDIWTKDIMPNEFINMLIKGDVDYIYCYNCDEQFKNTYESIFENKEDISTGNLYKVDKEDRCLKLVK